MMDKQYYPYDSYGYIITPTAKGGAVGVTIWSYECSCTTIHFLHYGTVTHSGCAHFMGSSELPIQF